MSPVSWLPDPAPLIGFCLNVGLGLGSEKVMCFFLDSATKWVSEKSVIEEKKIHMSLNSRRRRWTLDP